MTTPAQRYLTQQRASLAESIARDLKTLRHRIDDAIDSLTEGARLDPHLIANAVMLTEQIARWNMVRDLAPMVDDAPAPNEVSPRPAR